MGNIFLGANPDSAVYYHTRAKALAVLVKNELKAAEANWEIGRIAVNVGDFKKALESLNEALDVADRKKDDRRFLYLKGKILADIGIVYDYLADYSRALDYFSRAINIFKVFEDKKRIAGNLINSGIVYQELGDYPKALSVCLKGLKIAEEIKDKLWIANALNNIGIVYKEQADFSKALECFFKAEKLHEELKNNAVGGDLGNIGLAYGAQGNHIKALEYFLRALSFFKETDNKWDMAITAGNIGLTYVGMNNYPEALKFYQEALKADRETENKNGEALHLSNLGSLYVKMKMYNEAKDYLARSLTLCRELGTLSYEKDVERSLIELDSITGNFKGALEHYKKYIAVRDTISNEENTKKQTRAEMQYEFDKRESATKAEQERKDALAAADKKRQSIVLLSVAGFGLLVLGFAIFAYRSFLQKKKANEEISKQKELIEEKQKEILDSIYYARRIQRCLLTSERYIERKIIGLRNAS